MGADEDKNDPFAEYGPEITFPPMPRPTIAELEAILESEDARPITILPNGEIRALTDAEIAERPKRPLTIRENLGGEYGGPVVCNLAAWFNMPDTPYRPHSGRRKRQ